MSKWGRFAQIAAQLGPMALLFTPLAPIAGAVAQGIAEAQHLAGATGDEKRAHVKAIAAQAADALNQQQGRMVLDPALVQATADDAITTTYQAIKLVHDAHAAPVEKPAA